jgi:hypothetical protein
MREQHRNVLKLSIVIGRSLLSQCISWTALDIGQKIKVFVVFVRSAFSLTQLLLGLDEFDPFDPLNHLIAELILDSQP